jgi:hypothetical protein
VIAASSTPIKFAGFWIRLLAGLIDAVLLILLFSLVVYVVVVTIGDYIVDYKGLSDAVGFAVVAVVSTLLFLFYLFPFSLAGYAGKADLRPPPYTCGWRPYHRSPGTMPVSFVFRLGASGRPWLLHDRFGRSEDGPA